MAEMIVLSAFCLAIAACALTGVTVVAALVLGLLFFLVYGVHKGVGLPVMFRNGLESSRNAINVAVLLLLIGMISGSWRAAGTVAYLVDTASSFISPDTVLLMTFLSNAIISMLVGSSFATAASMGIVSMTMAVSAGVPAFLAGGAVLSGIYVGDRNSPISSSAMLVCAVCGTDIYGNVRLMARTSIVPLIVCTAVYGAAGWLLPLSSPGSGGGAGTFAGEFEMSWITLLPAAALLFLIAVRVPIRAAFALSIACAAAVAVFLQSQPAADALLALVFGYRARQPGCAGVLDGGGMVSMFQVCCIILVASTYIGIFRCTGLLRGVERVIPALASRITPMGALVLTAFVSSAVACNQVLAVMLTRELCRGIVPGRRAMAIALEDTAIVMPPLFPWSIACAVPLATIGAPPASVLAACFLYLLPLWAVLTQKSRAGLFRGDGP